MSLAKNLQMIKEQLPDHTKLIVVSKNRSVREINQLSFLGVSEFGENRVSEIQEKKLLIKDKDLKWHMVGHLQSNKAKFAVEHCDLIQSVDSLKLARKIDTAARKKNKKMAVLVQVNIAKEPQKHGFFEEDLVFSLNEMSKLENVRVLGLMMIPPFLPPEQTRNYFRKMKQLFDQIRTLDISHIDMRYLSMGMSNDFKVACEEGANMVRVGSSVFEGENHEKFQSINGE